MGQAVTKRMLTLFCKITSVNDFPVDVALVEETVIFAPSSFLFPELSDTCVARPTMRLGSGVDYA